MGGDHGSRPCVSAAVDFVSDYPDAEVVLVGPRQVLAPLLDEHCVSSGLSLVDAQGVVEMSDEPAKALRAAKDSSMWVALAMLQSNEADTCVSAGNTGALMAIARHLIKTISGIERPAICKPMPTPKGRSLLLDLGANIDCGAENLVQFAVMGDALARASGIHQPRVALLNIGSEVSKGNAVVKQAAAILTADPRIYYVGFIEGDELYSGSVDVIVCDGFVGNVALKVSEGLARFMRTSLDEHLEQNWFGRMSSTFLGAVLRKWSQTRNPSLYNGAAFLGLKKSVIKSHGSSDELGLYKALETAYEHVRAQIPDRIGAHIA